LTGGGRWAAGSSGMVVEVVAGALGRQVGLDNSLLPPSSWCRWLDSIEGRRKLWTRKRLGPMAMVGGGG
jgi:hypothetical protein